MTACYVTSFNLAFPGSITCILDPLTCHYLPVFICFCLTQPFFWIIFLTGIVAVIVASFANTTTSVPIFFAQLCSEHWHW